MKNIVLCIILLGACAATAAAQAAECLTEAEAQKAIASLNAPRATKGEDKKLRKELIDLRREREKLDARITADVEKNRPLIATANELGERHLLRVCQIIKQQGFPTRDALRDDGFAAFTFLIESNKAFALQRQLLPVLSAAAKKGLIRNQLLASLVDNLRLGAGQPQIFGTQATIRGEIVYLYPLLNEAKIDEWRKLYDLPPLAVDIRALEDRYLMPVLKSPRPPPPPTAANKNAPAGSETAALGLTGEEDEVLKIDTRVVNLNVRLLTEDQQPAPAALDLTKDDFVVTEDGVAQEVAYFSATERPFDLILLLDFSSSTADKRGLIKRAAQRFVEAVRAEDRVAVVAFTNEIKTVAELSSDKAAVLKKIDSIDMDGGSSIWDALQFVYEAIVKKESAGRRSAVVMMTDGEDGSYDTVFADVIETVRRGETTVFPVYLNPGGGFGERGARAQRKAQLSLSLLAEESGGQLYRAADAKDLTGVYEQVASDLGRIYSLGYEPKDETRDGRWRQLSVKVKNRPELVARTRRGYYAN